ncbi:hypothetical protein ACRAWD_02225 [Caulobacter segnis]
MTWSSRRSLNEDLAATAVWGSQQANLFPGALYDGVFGMWYGKAPGVDRTGDVFKHANFAGTFPTGGVLAVAGDDHGCKSAPDPAVAVRVRCFQDFEMPVLSPADVQEVLDYGILGISLSRFSGLWTGMIALADTMDSGVTIDVSLDRHKIVVPDFPFPPGGLGIRLKDQPMEKERRMRLHKLPAALAFARANHIDCVVLGASHVRVGKARPWHRLPGPGLTRTCWRPSRPWARPCRKPPTWASRSTRSACPGPLEPLGLRAFAAGLETLMVIEHKRALIEPQARAALCDLPAQARPRVIGKTDEKGGPLLSESWIPVRGGNRPGHLRPPAGRSAHGARARYLNRVSAAGVAAVSLAADQARKPFFCSGCPHNTSTKLPEGSRALSRHRLPLHGRVQRPDDRPQHPHGRRGPDLGRRRAVHGRKHVFQNLGDGTYNHSGSLAIRGAVAAKANITYKLLYNDAVAMTGGQRAESGLHPAQITRQLAAEGVTRDGRRGR